MISLFLGIETFNWSWNNFDDMIAFCKQHQIKSVVLKVYEITQGWWYQHLIVKYPNIANGEGQVIAYLKDHDIDVIPYGYFYGNDIDTEARAILRGLAYYGKFCINLEAEFDNHPEKAKELANKLRDGKRGVLYVSTWANPISHSWAMNIANLDDIVDIWMPEVYSDILLKELYAQFPKVRGKIEPTFHVTETYAPASSIYPNFSLWEYGVAKEYSGHLDTYVEINQGKDITMVSAPTNGKGMVANYRQVSQFQPGKSEFECGSFAVSLNWRSTAPDKPNVYNVYNLVQYAEALYAMVTGSNSASNTMGVTVDDMHTMLKDTQKHPSGPPPLHFWDMPININTKQEDDIARIKTALQHGYPVIATVTESSVYDVDLKRNPYWWGPSGNHIITWVGVASDGNLLAVDPANVKRGDGNLQTVKEVESWPRKYDIKSIQHHWATTIQPAWCSPIKDSDPLKWPAYQPPQPPPPTQVEDNVKITYDPHSKQLIFYDSSTNVVIHRIQL